MLNSNFKFHPVGQGSFYTGHLKLYNKSHKEFNFVYDCGSLSDRNNINESIKYYKKRLWHNSLDVLFISHLDDDHINGVKDLLDGIRCENIYLPYLTPFERLFVAITHNLRDVDNFNDFINFVISPSDYILSIEGANIGKINYIKGNSENDLPHDKAPEKPLNPDNFDNEFIDNLEILLKSEFNEEILKLTKDQKIVFKKANGKLKFGIVWEFYLYNEPGTTNQTDNFIESIEKIYGFRVNEQLTQAELNTILSARDNLKKLKIKFRNTFKNLNKTGLIVQHKPLAHKQSFLHKEESFHSNIEHYFNPFYRRLKRFHFKNIDPIEYNWGVTLLTGDIGLNQIENSFYVKNHLNYVLVFQVPHHGSNTGWNRDFLRNLNHKGKTSAIINFGYGNTYGHPKPNILLDLDSDNFDIRFCNQFESFEYTIDLMF
ncbi:ComEC/Rec2 family competence protein [Flavobacterium degerlachei]|jgi:hypothetical protein|uniref:Metallo-beta-lactamase superfamily protein n=1 Tax=Flavobacterium degerlachei TaxID=229203 RepID=A0A1H3CF53_9FLAO|nr:hypothetical protein [Flavobacterium degerlachei]SDX52736.1 hypothetical protein SAMN05444338_11199 [Flavobacterium degerlachei]